MSDGQVEKQHVIFLCTGNSARSQMAEAFLRRHGSDRFEAHSAGLHPKEINPLTVQVMEEVGIGIGPFGATVLSWPLDDPASYEDILEARLEKFRAVRDEIEVRIQQWLDEL